MTKYRFLLTLNCFLLISLILSACAGAPTLPIPNFLAPTIALDLPNVKREYLA